MPGFLLHLTAQVRCLHSGDAQPSAVNARVLVAGQPTVVVTAPHIIAGCTLPPQAGGPCVTAQWTTAATRITSAGQPLLLFDSQATCAPPGTNLLVLSTQTRVTGQ